MRSILILILLSAAIVLNGCGGGKKKRTIETKPVSVKQFDTPPGADPSVSAEQGGEGFKGEGWETSANYNIIGDPNAVKGGALNMSIPDFPATLRNIGKDENSYFNRMAEKMTHESLVTSDPVNDSYIPRLATHWQISEDKMQFKFRINPNARWADGKPVVAEDVIATWKLLIDPGILSPYSNLLYSDYEQPIAESKYIVSVKTKKLNWRQFLYFAGMSIFPAHVIGGLPGKDFLEKFQFEPINGSGPYIIDKDAINKGTSITLRRRSDYWGEKERFATGLFNFDFVKFEVNTDPSLEFEKFKKGDLDVISVSRAQWWEERFDFDEYKRGLVQKRRVYNERPIGPSGIVFNMRKAPFDDIRVRKAFALLLDRDKFNEKLFFKAYEMMDSYFPGTVYENKDNPKVRYNLDEAVKLLNEAGWTQKNSEGYLVKDGRVFEVELPFESPSQERYLTIYQEDMKKAGIKLNLRQVDGTTNFKLGNERNFSMIMITWGGLNPPNPESSMKSNTADEPNSTNWAGIKDTRIDALCDQYNVAFTREERIRIIREIDAIMASHHPYALFWYGPYVRIAFHNKFGQPPYFLPRFDGLMDADHLAVPILWYADPDKMAEYDAARQDKNKTLAAGEVDVKFWTDMKAKEDKGEKVTIDETMFSDN